MRIEQRLEVVAHEDATGEIPVVQPAVDRDRARRGHGANLVVARLLRESRRSEVEQHQGCRKCDGLSVHVAKGRLAFQSDLCKG